MTQQKWKSWLPRIHQRCDNAVRTLINMMTRQFDLVRCIHSRLRATVTSYVAKINEPWETNEIPVHSTLNYDTRMTDKDSGRPSFKIVRSGGYHLHLQPVETPDFDGLAPESLVVDKRWRVERRTGMRKSASVIKL